MAKQNVAEQETLGEAMNKTELFFERNGRTMSYVFLGLLVLAALVFAQRLITESYPLLLWLLIRNSKIKRSSFA